MNARAFAVKKGYKKKALQTHPDKLPANATAEAKRQAEEQFRLVSYDQGYSSPVLIVVKLGEQCL